MTKLFAILSMLAFAALTFAWRPLFRSLAGVGLAITLTGPGATHTYVAPTIADSTGKMSTKLTARKRYLPRIEIGVEQFNKISSPEEFRVFAQDDFPGFKRALSLFGASLRKNEVPDEISRTAEEKTEVIAKIVEKTSSSGAKESFSDNLKAVREAIDEYLSFAKLPLSGAAGSVYKL
jgi:hypothetical protein